MKNGLARFEYFLVKVEALLQQGIKEKNPGLWLYTNEIRTPLFMLEGLSKLYAGIHNEKKFEKLRGDFKLLEDALGAVDYYDGFAKEFTDNATKPPEIAAYLQAQVREKIQHFNELLERRDWIGEAPDRLKKIRKKLNEADWLKDEKEINAIRRFYENSINEINIFVAKQLPFSDLETQVHELRRELRWLSIYPRALQGAIQLTEQHIADESMDRYLVKEIMDSPYNKMPGPGNNRIILELEKNYFLALSWMIAELGKLKDDGLRLLATAEAMQQTKEIKHTEALALAYELLGVKQPTLDAILKEASRTCGIYFNEKNLDQLIHGISNTGKAGN